MEFDRIPYNYYFPQIITIRVQGMYGIYCTVRSLLPILKRVFTTHAVHLLYGANYPRTQALQEEEEKESGTHHIACVCAGGPQKNVG